MLECAYHDRRSVQAINVGDVILARAASTRMEGPRRRRYTLVAMAVLHLQIRVTILAAVAKVLVRHLLLRF